jgi:Integrase core domain
VWWLRLGIRLERIAPGHPEQNGRHERMHLTLKQEATRPAAHNVLQQQMRFDTFVHRFNHERPHQALDMATPASRYTPSTRIHQGSTSSSTPSTTGPRSSRAADACAISVAKSIRVRCLPGRRWA